MSRPPSTTDRLTQLLVIVAVLGLPVVFATALTFFQNAWQAVGLTIVYVATLALVGLVSGVWTKLQSVIVEAAASDVQKWLLRRFPSPYRRLYIEYIIHHNRTFDVKGLSTQGPYTLELEKVFVDLRISPEARPSGNLIPQELRAGGHSIWQFLENQGLQHLAILGAPGSGKTTLLKFVTLSLATRSRRCPDNVRNKIPVLLYIRNYAGLINENPATRLSDVIYRNVEYMDERPPVGWFDEELKAGRCVIMLDGLDEVTDWELRRKVAEWVERQITNYEQNRFIVTSRPYAFSANAISGVTKLEILPFNQAQAAQFVKNWYLANEIMSYGKDDPGVRMEAYRGAEDLITRIQSSPDIAELAVNPLLITMIATVHRFRSSLPSRRVELYGEMCEVFLGRRDEYRNIADGLLPSQKQFILQRLAYHMMLHHQREISSAYALSVIDEPIRQIAEGFDGRSFLRSISERSGLLLETEPDSYSFSHRSFQEFLASRVFVQSPSLINESIISSVWWHETIQLYAASSDATPVIEAILGMEKPSGSVLLLALNSLEDAREIEPKVRIRLQEYIENELGYGGIERRQEILDILRTVDFDIEINTLLSEHDRVKVTFADKSGFYANTLSELSLDVSNLTAASVSTQFQLDSTSQYLVKSGENTSNLELNPGQTTSLSYGILTLTTGKIPLQIKIGNNLYLPALEILVVEDNPYIYGAVIKDKTNFYGRESEVQRILNNIAGANSTHSMLIGEQRSGKSSLLAYLEQLLDYPIMPISISFAGFPRSDEIAALEWLLDMIIRSIIKQCGIGAFAPAPLKYGSDFVDELRRLIEVVKARDNKARLVLLLDEAHLVSSAGDIFQEILREAFIQLGEDIRVVFACYYNFAENVQSVGSPLQNIFNYIYLEPLNDETLAKLILEPAKHFGKSFTNSARARIQKLCGGQPYYCQALCKESFNRAKLTPIITEEHVSQAERQLRVELRTNFVSGYWEPMLLEERQFLKALVTGKSQGSPTKHVIKRLKQKFLVTENEGTFEVAAKLFESWIFELSVD